MRIAGRGENAGRAVLVLWAALAILALHAATDSFIAPEPGTGPLDQLLRGSVSLPIFEAASEPETVWRVDEAEHVGGFDARPREYEERVIGFFDQALLQASD